MKETWNKAINEIDEKFISETAQTLAKNTQKMQQREQHEIEVSNPISIKPDVQPKRGKGKIIGISAAAAVLVAAGIGGGIWLGSGGKLPVDTSAGITSADTVKPYGEASYQKYVMQGAEEDAANTLSDYYITELNELMQGTSSDMLSEVVGISRITGTLRLYPDSASDGYDEMALHMSVTGKYYYSISANGAIGYFELTEQQYNELENFFAMNMPNIMYCTVAETDGMNYTNPDEGFYLLGSSDSGDIYSVHDDGKFAVGDSVKVCYYGGIMETYPAQINKLWIKAVYDSDENAFNDTAYYKYFRGEWTSANGNNVTLDYTSGNYFTVSCRETSDSYMLVVDDTAYYIAKENTDVMYVYENYQQDVTEMDNYSAEYERTGEVSGMLEGRLNLMGMERLLGVFDDESFTACVDGICAGFKDTEGISWLPADDTTELYISDYRAGTTAFYAQFYMKYKRADFPEQTQWFAHIVQKVKNGADGEYQYETVASACCDENGNALPNGDGMHLERDRISGTDYFANVSYAVTQTNGETLASLISVYVSSKTSNEVLVSSNIQSAYIRSSGGSIPENTSITVQEIPIYDGGVFAVFVPVQYSADVIKYAPSFYYFDGTELAYISGNGMLADRAYATVTNNTFMMIVDGVAEYFTVDTTDKLLTNADERQVDGSIISQRSEAAPENLGVYQCFGGVWVGDSGMLDFNMDSDVFSFANPCLGWSSDDLGYYMYGEDSVWYIAKDQTNTMYYFDNASGDNKLMLSDCTAVYTLYKSFGGFGGSKLGYFGLMDMGATYGGIDSLFDMEITDDNGTHWVRTSDRSVDWGGIYSLMVNRSSLYALKMQNKSNPSEMKYFTFDFIKDSDTLRWTDEHYCVDVSVCDTAQISTELSKEVQNQCEAIEHGRFINNARIELCGDGSSYAYRKMGNSMAQWIVNSEIFYNDGSGYKLITDSLTAADAVGYDGRLYVLYSAENGLGLNVYDKMQLCSSIEFTSGGQIMQMSTSYGLRGNYLVVSYYDADKSSDVYAVFDCTSANPEPMYYDELQFNDDGTITF